MKGSPFVFAALFLGAASVFAQTKAAELQKYQEAVYPETLLKDERQGNVLLVGRIDKEGRMQDLRLFAASFPGFIDPAMAAVKAWRFKPATRDGKPVDIAANVGVRFRVKGNKRGRLAEPILGDLPIFPADGSGQKTAPEGFPIRPGVDSKLRAEAVLDVAPQPKARKITVRVEATSPTGRPYILLDGPVAVDGGATDVHVPVVAPVGADWEEGVWTMRFLANGGEAGGGQFWLARDPTRFDFAAALRKR